MADEEKPEEGTEEDSGSKGGGGLGGKIATIALSAVFAGAAGFAGAYFGAPKAAGNDGVKVDKDKIPGPTVALKAFVWNVTNTKTGKQHAVKMSISIELTKKATPEQFETFQPRVRDAILAYLRTLTYAEARNPKTKDQITEDLLDKIHKLGATIAARVLVGDFVMQ